MLKFEDFAGFGGSRIAPWTCPVQHPTNIVWNNSEDGEFDGILCFGDVAEAGVIRKSLEMIRNTLPCCLSIHLYRYIQCLEAPLKRDSHTARYFYTVLHERKASPPRSLP